MRKKNDLDGLEQELVTMIMVLESSLKHILRRLSEIKKYKDSGSVPSGALEILKIVEEDARKVQEKACGEKFQLRKQQFDRQQNPEMRKHSSHGNTYNSQDMKLAKAKIENLMTELQGMHKTLDNSEEKFCMYNVPKHDAIDRSNFPESFNWYLERLTEFMQVTWKVKAEKCRKQEHKSLIEWMAKLAESEDERKRFTLKALRVVLIDTGMKISNFLTQYSLIVSVSADREQMAANLFEVESIIRCLSVEENSIVIDTFVSVVKLFNGTMRTMMNPKTKIDTIKKSDSRIGKENEVLRLIIIEVLRLEVGYCYPDLPMMVSNEVFFAMGKHLKDNVFKDKLETLSSKIDGLKILELVSVGDKDSTRKSLEQVLNHGVKEIWMQLYKGLYKVVEPFISFPTPTHLCKSDIGARRCGQYTIQISSSLRSGYCTRTITEILEVDLALVFVFHTILHPNDSHSPSC
ncbi:hypothetical protein L484_015654 [Morus notabilis]|uniref:Uncharacterized protein n=1 Tax=Morus notabilis TaxID=981085 RepID=W9QY55_9ROSA|nr:hypothetical protein L484_015654 [Morus notabilis]